MKTFLTAFLAFALTASAFAEVIKYRLFDDSLDEFNNIYMDLEVTAKKPVGLVFKTNKQVLFSFNKTEMEKFFKVVTKDGITTIESKKNFKPRVKTEYSDGYMDSGITPGVDYSLYDFKFDKNFDFTESLYMGNEEVEESAFWGIPKKI
jgi:hypothetical protein